MDPLKLTFAAIGEATSLPIATHGRLFEIHQLDWLVARRHFEGSMPHRNESFEIIWVKKGAGVLSIDLHQYTIQQNMLYCIAPGQLRMFRSINGLQGYHINVPAELLHMIESEVNLGPLTARYGEGWNLLPVQADHETQDELEVLLNKMSREFANSFPMKSELLKGYLKIFMICLSRKMSGQIPVATHHRDFEMVKKFMALLRNNFTTKKMVADYADELCVTPNYLNLVVKKITGHSVSHHIQQYIILEAKRYALCSGWRMKEIADFLGFDDCAHFSKFFKNYSGMKFSSFRKGLQSTV